MFIAMKRYRYLIPLGIIFLWVLIYYWTYRVISVNIWDEWEVTTDYFDIKNTIDLFDITQTHEIKILMTEKDYVDMINSYAKTSKKNRYKTDVVIDGVTIYGVGIRLKWNWVLQQIEWNKLWTKNVINYNKKLPLFIRFNKYINQTYEWHEMIVLRVGREEESTLLAEPYGYKLYQQVWQPAPDISHGLVKINWKDVWLFIISELPEDKYYIQKRFWNDNGVLYKAWNYVYFGYLWEDPTLYADYFTQKTRIKDFDLSPLIRMLKFISESDDEEFKEKIGEYVDVKSVLTNLAIDDFLCNLDSFWWNWSNFYLYYNLWEKKFYILTWDQDLAIRRSCIKRSLNRDPTNWILSDSLKASWLVLLSWRKENILKWRLLSVPQFKTMYNEIYKDVERIAVDSNFTQNFLDEWSGISPSYYKKYWLKNSINYRLETHRLRNYIDTKKSK